MNVTTEVLVTVRVLGQSTLSGDNTLNRITGEAQRTALDTVRTALSGKPNIVIVKAEAPIVIIEGSGN